MAAQCCSSRCSAERKGFRRELDSWRHKLIHCVGFESILEGIYGPRLVQDLNIFDDCEPEVLDDWTTDARCSFCNLQLDKLSDHLPSVASPGSPPPAETPPPQGLSTSDQLQCQAEQFLNAVFRRKEFPESCDPSIPLAAQDLMRKMIRQFAIEYACRSQSPEGSDVLCCVSTAEPSEGPLDLTVSRNTHCPQQDGVLDLSKKNSSSVSGSQQGSGSLGPLDEEDECVKGSEEEVHEKDRRGGTVLEKVLCSLCPYHRRLLHSILLDLKEDCTMPEVLRESRRHCPPGKTESHSGRRPLPEHASSSLLQNGTTSGCAGCFKILSPALPCLCAKTLGEVPDQNIVASGRVDSALCCNHCRILPCQHLANPEDAWVTGEREAPNVPDACASDASASPGNRSPSPPPLSPIPLDTEGKTSEKNASNRCHDVASLSTQPPPLLPHRTEERDDDGCPARSESKLLTSVKSADTEEENEQHCGSFIGNLMDQFTEKLKNIQPSDKELSLNAHEGQDSKTCDDTHLTEIITTLLHSSTGQEYDLKKLFEQHMATEQRSPQTRSRRRQEVLEAMSRSPDLSATRRLNLQIKRDLARLDPPVCRKKLTLEKSKCPKTSLPLRPSDPVTLLNQRVSDTVDAEPANTVLQSQSQGEDLLRLTPEKQNQQLCENLPPKKSPKSHRSENIQHNGKLGRSRRNIVPPQRFSSYVTEPRKMFYAACFSESIFSKSSTAGDTKYQCAEMSHMSPEKPVQTEAQDHITHPQKDDTVGVMHKHKTSVDSTNEENVSFRRSPRKLARSKLKVCEVSSVLESPGSATAPGQSAEVENSDDAEKSSLKYTSPIKLMLVSPVKGENGVKYSLKAADAGPGSNGGMFDPCVESSWAGIAVNEEILDSPSHADYDSECNGESSILLPKGMAGAETDLTNRLGTAGETAQAVSVELPPKRRPGRPKKLGPQIEKTVKRPIGRPPKPKTEDGDKLNGKNQNQKANETSGDDANKNLKITIVYGRSRKARRVVSEDQGHLSAETPCATIKTYSKRMSPGESSLPDKAKEDLEDLHLVMPVEDRKVASNIKCQKQSGIAVNRKPGRPAKKVKISGISVTVTTVSPRQRRIHMKKDVKESPKQRRNLLKELQSSKEQKTISEYNSSDCGGKVDVGTIKGGSSCSRALFVPVRHSQRERKPSIHLLHSVATARSFSRSNALVRRSRNLLISKANAESNQQTQQRKPDVTSDNALSKMPVDGIRTPEAVHFGGVAVDSIFAANESLRWWPISASPDTLNEELARRIRLMSDTWVPEVLEMDKLEEIQTSQKPKSPDSSGESNSAIRMLFERSYSMDKLCSWFMQTTETQSLAIVKKQCNARNPYEVFHYNSVRPSCSVNICPSAQAERLRKHVMKFAQVVPKTPRMHQRMQAMLYRARRSVARHHLQNVSKSKSAPGLNGSSGSWGAYRAALHRAKAKFRSGAKNCKHRLDQATGVPTETASTAKDKISGCQPVQSSEKTPCVSPLSKQEVFSSKAWSPETLKECKVFLKRINSPNAKSLSEECNICTVKLNFSPDGCDVSVEQEEQKSSKCVRMQSSCNSPWRNAAAASLTGRNKPGRKRSICRSKSSPPAKLARQSRSSRGVLSARWCDFVLGPSK